MSELPRDKKLKRIFYDYGSEIYFIEGTDLENFQKNVDSASVLAFSHSLSFDPINWKKLKGRICLGVKGRNKKQIK